MWRAMVLVLVLGACDDSRPVEFQLTLGVVPEAVVDIAIDDPAVELTFIPDADAAERAIQLVRIYDSYDEAARSPRIEITFTFYDGAVVESAARFGTCGVHCRYPQCPTRDELVLEAVYLHELPFGSRDFVCVQCQGGGKNVVSCE
jgi:hypothetical protein